MELKVVEKKVQKFSKAGYGIYLTKELKELGNPESVFVISFGDKLLILPKNNEADVSKLIRPLNVKPEVWRDFVYIIEIINDKISYELINNSLEEAIKKWIKDQEEVRYIITLWRKKRIKKK